MDSIWAGLYHAFAMFWATLWALIIGFGISAALQVFVSKEQMVRMFGQTNLKTMILATTLGAASSSCSYAAAAASRSAFQKGAALIPALAFMFASTNLVAELAALIWVLMGWQFVLAEIIGAFVLIGVMWLLASFFLKPDLEKKAREHAMRSVESHGGSCSGDHSGHGAHESSDPLVPSRRWQRLADAFITDWRMLWKELAAGFLIAGFLSALIPPDWWRVLFIEQGNSVLRLIENAAVGPVIAMASFVCSCANIPLANVLWSNGISFGGVISFIYADLLAVPLLVIYVKYYGARAAAFIIGILYVSMVLAGIVIDLLFNALGIVPGARHAHGHMEHEMIALNYTTWLNFAAIALGAWLLYVHLARRSEPSH